MYNWKRSNRVVVGFVLISTWSGNLIVRDCFRAGLLELAVACFAVLACCAVLAWAPELRGLVQTASVEQQPVLI